MEYDVKLSVTGAYKGREMLFVMELTGEDYICKKAVNLGKGDKGAIHSIINYESSVYLADSYNNKIYKYDFDLNELSEATVGRDPRHMCIDEENMYMYVANFESDNVSVIDMSVFTMIESIPAGIKPHDVLFNKNNSRLYTCCYEENEIIEYLDSREKNRQFTSDGKPMHMLILEDSLILMTYYVNGNVHTKINFINLESGNIEDVIVLDGLSSDFDINNINKMLYLINIVDKSLYIIDIEKRKTAKTVFLGGYPESLAVGEKYVYVTNSKKNQICAIDIDKMTVSRYVDLGFSPSCIKIIN